MNRRHALAAFPFVVLGLGSGSQSMGQGTRAFDSASERVLKDYGSALEIEKNGLRVIVHEFGALEFVGTPDHDKARRIAEQLLED